MELADDFSTTHDTFAGMVDRSVLWSKVGLALGCFAFLGYLYSFFSHHRLKERIKEERETQRRLRRLELEEESRGQGQG